MPTFKVQLHIHDIWLRKRIDFASKKLCMGKIWASMMTFCGQTLLRLSIVMFKSYTIFNYEFSFVSISDRQRSELSKLSCILKYLRNCWKLRTPWLSSPFSIVLFVPCRALCMMYRSLYLSFCVCVSPPFRVIRCAPACVHHLSCWSSQHEIFQRK